MTFFQFKSFSFVNLAIKRIVQYIKTNARKQCFLVNLTNATFWKNTPRGQEILEFFKGMTDSQKIDFLGLFDMFFVGFHNGINAYVAMTANPSSLNFEKTVRISISKGYTQFSQNFSGRATPSIEGDLRSSIGPSPVQHAGFSASPASGVRDSSVENGLSNFGPFSPFQEFEGPATQPVSPFQGFGGGPRSGFSQFSAQSPSFGGYFQPIAKGGSTNPFTSLADFVFVQPTDGVVSRQSQTRLEIRKGRVIRVEIPSDCSSGPTVGIAKSPKAPTPISTTIANLEKKIARLESENPAEGSSDYLTLVVSRAKLEKIRNSL
jgi:hypothetical protein